MHNEKATLDRALAFHDQGNLADAMRLYRRIISANPNNIEAVHFLGLAEAATGNIDRARSLVERSLQSSPLNFDFVQNYASILHRAGQYDAVIKLCDRFLPLAPDNLPLRQVRAAALLAQDRTPEAITQLRQLLADHPEHVTAHAMLGASLARSGQFDAALVSFDRALALNPSLAQVILDKGTLHFNCRRFEEALAAYEKALAARPGYAEASLGCCYALIKLGRHEEALAASEQALSWTPNFAEAWVGRGNAFFELDRLQDAATAYANALALKPASATAWLGQGNVLEKMGRHSEAMVAFDRVLEIDSKFAEAWLGRGRLLLLLGRPDEALTCIDRAIVSDPSLTNAWNARGQACFLMKRYLDALTDWSKSLELDPDQSAIAAARLRVKMHLCDWRGFDAACAAITKSVRDGKTVSPFVLVALPSTPADQLQSARQWVRQHGLCNVEPIWHGEQYSHDRIRIGYLSADFHEHATSQLMAGLFEHHDRSRFDVTAISVGPNDGSEMRRRIEASFERFIDASAQDDRQIAEMVRAFEIDILVDLKGFTQGARTGVFAARPAPLQVNYLGFPGTIGGSFMDYIISDRHLIHEDECDCYAEKVVWLPDSYQANDDRRSVPGFVPPRSSHGLPDDAFVFCCFNDNYKTTPIVFSSWMRILKAVENSVLWLFEENSHVANNLRREAQARGIASTRLIFGRFLPSAEHLARQRCADLFLDTLPYNAHTTASDALWAGLPVLSCIGETFAARVGASVLDAVGLPELAVPTFVEYERLAIELATDRSRLEAIKTRLVRNRPTAALFDTAQFTRHIEAAYTAMNERRLSGLPPDHIHVPRAPAQDRVARQ